MRKKSKTLVFFLRGLYNQKVIVQLLNETRIEGSLFNVDDSLNIILENAKLLPNEDAPALIANNETPPMFEDIYINGRNVRFVEPIENRFNATQVLDNYSRRLREAADMYKRKKKK